MVWVNMVRGTCLVYMPRVAVPSKTTAMGTPSPISTRNMTARRAKDTFHSPFRAAVNLPMEPTRKYTVVKTMEIPHKTTAVDK